MQIWSASRHALATNRTSTSISGSARVHRAQQLQVLFTNWLCSSRFERFQRRLNRRRGRILSVILSHYMRIH